MELFNPANEPERFQWVDEHNQLHWLTKEELDEKNG
jgi:hypothetical protein